VADDEAVTEDGTVADETVAPGTVADGTVADETVADATVGDDEREIRTLIQRWAVAAHTGDLDGVVADHAENIVMFDVPPPHDGVRGALLRCGTAAELAARPEQQLRLTIGLRKERGRWTVGHEHHSFASID
jgi:ketosteroid isomerase-like protein